MKLTDLLSAVADGTYVCVHGYINADLKVIAWHAGGDDVEDFMNGLNDCKVTRVSAFGTTITIEIAKEEN